MNGQFLSNGEMSDLRRRTEELEAALQQAADERAHLLSELAEQRRVQEQLRLIVDSVPVLVSYLDGEERYRFNNRAYEDWFGRSRQEVHGKHIKEVIGEAAYEKVRSHLQAALSGRKVSYESWLPYKDGGPRYVSATYVPHLDPGNRPQGVIALVSDITPSRSADTVRLTELQEQAEELIRAVSHDLRTPLTAIQGYAQLLRRLLKDVPLEQRADISLEHIIKGARRMNAMIQDLVDSARIESGQISIRVRPVHLQSLMKNLLEESAEEMETDRVQVEIPESTGLVEADATALGRIMTNLLANALRYSSEGAQVFVRASRKGGSVELSVTGKGGRMSQDDLSHLFDRFRRVGQLQASQELGLGMYIAKKLVEAHGGALGVQSQVGEGVTFRFSLPATQPGGPD